jgi:Cu-processing system permease protein
MRGLVLHSLGAWRTGVRNRGVQALLALAVFVVGLSWLTASFSGRQPQTVAFDMGISLVRLLGALLAAFWVQELLVRDIERRTVFWALAYPVSRTAYLLGRSVGVFALLGLYVALMATMLFLTLKLVGLDGYQQAFPVQMGWGYALTFLLIFLDLVVIACFAVALASQATVAMLPFFAALALAFSARMIGPVQQYLLEQIEQIKDTTSSTSLRPIIESLSWVLPDLSRLDVRETVLYGYWPSTGDIVFSSLQAGFYGALLLVLASWVFERREFE